MQSLLSIKFFGIKFFSVKVFGKCLRVIAVPMLLVLFVLLLLGTAESRVSAQVSEKAGKADLQIKANVYFGDEDSEVLPLETRFYLLDKSFVEILKESELEFDTDRTTQPASDEDYAAAAAEAFADREEDAPLIRQLILRTVSRHEQAIIETDDTGTGYAPVMQGKYYLFGAAQIEHQTLIWNLECTIKPGKNRIEIDQYNASAIVESSE